MQDRVGQAAGVALVEWPPAGRHLEEDHAERVDVGTRIDGFATHLFGCHVRQRSGNLARRLGGGLIDIGDRARQLRDAEIQHFRPALRRDDDIGRLEVAMDDAALVRFFESGGHVAGKRDDLSLGQRPGGDALGERRSRDVLHDEEVDPVGAVEVVNGGDVGVVQARQGLRFAAESPPRRFVAQHPRRQHLDGDVAVEVRVVRAVDLSHPAGAEALEDSIVRERAADHFGGRGSAAR